MSDIRSNLSMVNDQISAAAVNCGRAPQDIELIAVSKKKSAQAVEQAIQAGAVNFGENYIQEAVKKIDEVGKENACWHFIGHLQSNKARLAVQYFDYIHTVDSVKLAREINKRAAAIQKTQNILVQINISSESTKSGTDPKSVIDLITEISVLDSISIKGLMGMPPFLSDPEAVRPYFKEIANLRDKVNSLQIPNVYMEYLSMGMSGDFQVAIEEGSTMVRVGTAIFGRRE